MRKVKIYSFLIVFILSFFPDVLYSQERVVKGTVTISDTIPVVHARVTVKSSKQVYLTDTSGEFEATCGSDDKLKIEAEGFYKQNIKVGEETGMVEINLEFRPNPKSFDLALGNGHINERDKLTVQNSLNNAGEDFSTYNDIYEILENRFPGVEVVGSEIIIRGAASAGSSNAALIVIDGIISDYSALGMLHPLDIKKIDILKGGGSVSIYGSRGGNGVVRITTKHAGDF